MYSGMKLAMLIQDVSHDKGREFSNTKLYIFKDH